MKELKQKDKKENWDSGIKILKKVKVIIPVKLLLVCNQIAEKVEEEFSIVTNILEKDDMNVMLSEEYYIPKQEVETTFINYLPDVYTMNTVIHRHPDGMNSFSGTDEKYINQNFELSLLYTQRDGFVCGQYNLRHETEFLIQLPVEIYIDHGLEEIDISNIHKPAPLVLTDKPRRRESKRRFHDDVTWDYKKEPDEKEKLLVEESLDYSLMKNFLLDEVTEKVQGIETRLDTVEENLFHMNGFYADGLSY